MQVSSSEFPTERVTENGSHGYYRIAHCATCDASARWKDNKRRGAPDLLVAAGFRKMGWDMSDKGKGSCPSCSEDKRELTPAQRRAIWCRNNLPKKEPSMKAEPPRIPTREDRRRIQEALDHAYDVDEQRYAASFSDEAMAKQLSLPRAWIAEERDRAYGPPWNEAEAKRDQEFEQLKANLMVQRDAAMKAAEAAMDAASKIDSALAQLSGVRPRLTA